MMTVPLLDLRVQYDAIRTEIDDAIRRVMESCRFIGGPEVMALEEEVAKLRREVEDQRREPLAVANQTRALGRADSPHAASLHAVLGAGAFFLRRGGENVPFPRPV